MGMTKNEQIAKEQIIDILLKDGYKTYAQLFSLFDLNLTNDPESIAYMIPDKGVIVINANVDTDQVSVLVRHEILHEYLAHKLRMEKHLGDDKYAKRSPLMHQLMNIAGDFEISNRGYTDKDKQTVRSIRLNDKVLSGLVTEDEHPDWYDEKTGQGLSFEEMYDKLAEESEKNKDAVEKMIDQMMKDFDINPEDSPTQKAEQIAREAQIAKEEAEDAQEKAKEGSGSDDHQQDDDANNGSSNDGSESKKDENGTSSASAAKASKIADAAQDLADDAEKQAQDKKKDGRVFDTPEDQEKAKELQGRLERIKKAFDDLRKDQEQENKLFDKADQEKENKRIAQKERDLAQYKEKPLTKFRLSLEKFIKRSIETQRDRSWSRQNRRYYGTNIIAPGKAIQEKRKPTIAMYLDQSGSWSDADVAFGKRCISTIKKNYVDKGKIKLNLYYFSNNVHGDAKDARAEGGTEGQPIINHIKATKPDNVIVFTDSDIHDITTKVTVPGAVWLLFKNGRRSENLQDNLHGAQLTRSFDIDPKNNND